MSLPYPAALAEVESYCVSFLEALMDVSLAPEVRRSLRERRDYWHALGSRIRRRMAREGKRRST